MLKLRSLSESSLLLSQHLIFMPLASEDLLDLGSEAHWLLLNKSWLLNEASLGTKWLDTKTT
jgi:hypothetical protein